MNQSTPRKMSTTLFRYREKEPDGNTIEDYIEGDALLYRTVYNCSGLVLRFYADEDGFEWVRQWYGEGPLDHNPNLPMKLDKLTFIPKPFANKKAKP